VLAPVLLILHKERRGHDVRNIELAEQVAGHGDGEASLGGAGRAAHQRKAHRIDHRVHSEPGEPFAHDDMALDTLDEDRQHAQTGGLERAHQVGMVMGAAEDMGAEGEDRDRAQGGRGCAGALAAGAGALLLPV
jgi:hypothetical protein